MYRRYHIVDLGVDGRITLDWILRETGWEGVDWIQLAQNMDQWQVEQCNEPSGSINGEEFLE
jgi:hypothetical protein